MGWDLLLVCVAENNKLVYIRKTTAEICIVMNLRWQLCNNIYTFNNDKTTKYQIKGFSVIQIFLDLSLQVSRGNS